MKSMTHACTTSRKSIPYAVLLLSAAAHAQPMPATAAPDAAAAPLQPAMNPSNSAPAPTPAAPDASVLPATAQTQAEPATAGVSAASPESPAVVSTANTELPPLPPIAKGDTEKKKLKGKKARRAALKESRDAGDELWGDPWGDSQDELRAAGMSFRFLLQTHYRQTFAYHSNNPDLFYRVGEENIVRSGDGWDMNRLFFRIVAEPSKYVGLRMITDFAEFAHKNGKNALKQAFVDLRPVPKHVHFLAGVLKLPFSITELDHIADYEFTRMSASNELVKGLGFAGRDIGVEVMVSPLAKPRYLTVALGTFRGHADKEQGYLFGEVGARAETEPIRGLRFGADWEIMPKTVTYLNPFGTGSKTILPNPEDPNFPRSSRWDKGQAASGDITFHQGGVMLRTEGMVGKRVDHFTRYGASKFAAVWGIAAYRFPVGPLALQPALRAEWLDTDLDHSNGVRTQLAAGIATYFTKSVRFVLDIERTIVQDNSPLVSDQPLPLRQVPYNALSNTCVGGQVQVEL
jgi:hypothetical protein